MQMRKHRLGIAICLFIGLAACAAPIPPDALGVISSIQGNTARFNGEPARTGQLIHKGDQVSTAAKTKVDVRLRNGGFVEIDPNTDPWFDEIKSYAEEGSCLLVKVAFGTIFVNAKKVCIEDGYLAGAAGSQIWLRSTSAGSYLVVVEGHFTLSRPLVQTLQTNDSLRVGTGRTPVIQRLGSGDVQKETGHSVGGGMVLPNGGPVKPPENEPRSEWCCRSGETFTATPQHCKGQGGRSFPTQRAAQQECAKVIVK